MKQTKMKYTNWSQMRNRKSTNMPYVRFIFACALTLNWVFSEFLEAKFPSSKGIFALFIEHLGPICLLHVVKSNVT